MNTKTVEVHLENGKIRPVGNEELPATGRGFLTLVEAENDGPAKTCAELAERWENIPRLPPDEAEVFANDIEQLRASLNIPPQTKWD